MAEQKRYIVTIDRGLMIDEEYHALFDAVYATPDSVEGLVEKGHLKPDDVPGETILEEEVAEALDENGEIDVEFPAFDKLERPRKLRK